MNFGTYPGIVQRSRLGQGRWVVTDTDTTMVAGTSFLSSPPVDAAVTSLLNLNGANGSTTFTDALGVTWTGNGNARISTAQSQFGGASMLVDGTGDFISTTSTAPFAFPGSFTVEFWVYPTSVGAGDRGLFFTCANTVGAGGIGIYFPSNTSSIQVAEYVGTTNLFGSPPSVSLNTWTHVALVRNGSAVTLYLNGVSSATAAFASALTAQGTGVAIGAIRAGSDAGNGMIGYLDDFRVSNTARYAANFTPPTVQFFASQPLDFSVPASISPGDFFAVNASLGDVRVLPGAGRQIGSAGVGTAVSLTAGQTLRIVARTDTQLEIV